MNYERLPSAAAPLVRLIEELGKLPGIGAKSAQRLAYHLIKSPIEDSNSLASAIMAIKDKIVLCEICQNITELNPCSICESSQRDNNKICVVEEPLDVISIEKTGAYKGLYHVLHGAISPASGIGPTDIKIQELMSRIENKNISEVILATNPSLEGENTAMYLQRIVSPLVAKITRLARGLPVGGNLEYADEITISRALEGRQEV
ncbi:MAG: recombination mediator RecR [Dehalococcoidia bacterium]|nr:recombination mediator RecR [Dehalococcoidia bacterium]MQG00242.1 recombination protein RecR [SAR202 cluster bacterium]|tara:strand:+ start:290 stop:904 length:615 start_codon:yes stop_codon:yes gene_type:complete